MDGWSHGWGLSKCKALALSLHREITNGLKHQRLYLKGIDCSSVWMKGLGEALSEKPFNINGTADLVPALPEPRA